MGVQFYSAQETVASQYTHYSSDTMFFKGDKENLAFCIVVIIVMIILLSIPEIMTAAVGVMLAAASLGALYYGYTVYKSPSGLSITQTPA